MALKLLSQAAAFVLSMGVMVGCGQLPMLTASNDKDALAYRGNGDLLARGPKNDLKNGPLGLLSAVDLSDEQKAQLKAIAEKYKPQKAAPRTEKPGARLKTVVESDPLDVEALKAALTEQPEAHVDAAPQLEFLKEARAVLTDNQRAGLITKLKAQPTPMPTQHAKRPAPTVEQKQAMLDQLATRLDLDESQKEAYAAFLAQLEANRERAERNAPNPVARRDALVAFLETGDTAPLEALKPAAVRPAFPVDEFVALAQSLSVEQRKLLLSGANGGHHGHHGR